MKIMSNELRDYLKENGDDLILMYLKLLRYRSLSHLIRYAEKNNLDAGICKLVELRSNVESAALEVLHQLKHYGCTKLFISPTIQELRNLGRNDIDLYHFHIETRMEFFQWLIDEAYSH
jgi:hypothetical protein